MVGPLWCNPRWEEEEEWTPGPSEGWAEAWGTYLWTWRLSPPLHSRPGLWLGWPTSHPQVSSCRPRPVCVGSFAARRGRPPTLAPAQTSPCGVGQPTGTVMLWKQWPHSLRWVVGSTENEHSGNSSHCNRKSANVLHTDPWGRCVGSWGAHGCYVKNLTVKVTPRMCAAASPGKGRAQSAGLLSGRWQGQSQGAPRPGAAAGNTEAAVETEALHWPPPVGHRPLRYPAGSEREWPSVSIIISKL